MATTPYPFVAGSVLTASQLNSTFNIPTTTKTASYVLTAADAGTRIYMNSASATTITVNTSIFSASDVVEIFNIGAGVTTITAGTATVSSAGPLAVPQYGSGRLTFTAAGASIYTPTAVTPTASALTLITAVSFSAQTTVAFANSVFTSTYERYLILLSAESSSGDSALTMQVRDNSGTKSAASYLGSVSGGTYDGNQSQLATNNLTSFKMGSTGQTQQSLWAFYVTSPTSTTLQTVWSGTCMLRGNGTFSVIGGVMGGYYGVDEAHTGLVFNWTVSSTGNYRVYGLADS